MAFSKLKALIRKTATRTYDRLWQAVGNLCDLFTDGQGYNFFKAAGYKPDQTRYALKNRTNGPVSIVMHRLHPNDLKGSLLAIPGIREQPSLSEIALHDKTWALPDGNELRRERGQAIAPELRHRDVAVLRHDVREEGAMWIKLSLALRTALWGYPVQRITGRVR